VWTEVPLKLNAPDKLVPRLARGFKDAFALVTWLRGGAGQYARIARMLRRVAGRMKQGGDMALQHAASGERIALQRGEDDIANFTSIALARPTTWN
jgi:hypothetical protein